MCLLAREDDFFSNVNHLYKQVYVLYVFLCFHELIHRVDFRKYKLL